MKFSKEGRRRRIQNRVRKKVAGTAARPRLSVYRSNKSIYCQLIDDDQGITLAYASSKDADLNVSGTKVDQAKQVGMALAQKAAGKSIEDVVFDRSGYLYHGRVKALAEGAREGGLKF